MASSLFGQNQNQPTAENPMAQMLKLARNGNDPKPFLRALSRNNPGLAQAVQLMDGGNSLQDIAVKLCQQRGTTPEAVAKQLGLF